MTAALAVSMRGITKRFPEVVANDHVDFDAAAGEVHALLGENGAGKTTLMNIVAGLYRADEGQILLHGQPVEFDSPREAIDAGIGMVHQHFRLVERFTVAENLVLGDRRGAGRRFNIDPAAVDSQVCALGERYRLPVDPHARIWQLSVGEQQRVEILNTLYEDARVLILDEPTAVLTPEESETLFATLRQMADEGRTVIFISHKLNEVKAVSDRVTVLRGGRAVATVDTASATEHSLAALMVGHDLEAPSRPPRPSVEQPLVVELEGVAATGDRGVAALRGVSLAMRAGEIVGVAGVAGNGQRELGEAIAGMRPLSAGTVRVDGKALANGDPRVAFDSGVRYIPEDRLGTGLAPRLSIAMNLDLRSFRTRSWGPFLQVGAMRERAAEAIEAFQIRGAAPELQTDHLSGGNLQKVVIARELSGAMRALVAASPTRGLDVGAAATVHRYLIEAAEAGVAVLLISEDLDEILALSDRVLVMYEGALAEVEQRDSIEEIGLRMAGAEPS